ncbi:hypothetical protein QUA35_08735 [Microcoleus sp. N9_B2]|uniref:hypothetical protein n=1 Tax=unclassified Microcoleus TaxID=2642155 RepID=UPI002FD55929
MTFSTCCEFLGPLRHDGGIIRAGKSITHIAFLLAEDILDQREVRDRAIALQYKIHT